MFVEQKNCFDFFHVARKKKSPPPTPLCGGCCISLHSGISISEVLLVRNGITALGISPLPSSFPPNSFSLQVQKMLLLIASSARSSWDWESS